MFIFENLIMLAAAATNAPPSSGMGWEPVHITIIISVLSLCATLLGVLPKAIAANKPVALEDKPSDSNMFCKQKVDSVNKLEVKVDNKGKEVDNLKEVINEVKITLAKLEKDVNSANKTVDEMKKDNKALAIRLEGLLSQLLGFIGE